MACGAQASRYHQLEHICVAPTGVEGGEEIVEEEWEWWMDLENNTKEGRQDMIALKPALPAV